MGLKNLIRKIFFKEEPWLLRAGWRFLVFAVLWLATVPLMRWIRLLLTGRASLASASDMVSDPYFILQRLTGIAGLFIATAVLLRWADRKPMSAIGTHLSPRALAEFGKGSLLGVLIMAGGFLALLLMGQAHVESLHLDQATMIAALAHYLPMTLVVGLYEEFLFRGYLFQSLCEGIRPLPAALITAAIFGVLHALNPGATAWGAVSTGIWSLFLAFLLLRTRSLWACIGLHFAGNFTQGFILGSRVSGQQYMQQLVDARFAGPEWLSSPSMGLEACLPTLIVLGACFFWVARGSWWRPAPGSRLLWDPVTRP